MGNIRWSLNLIYLIILIITSLSCATTEFNPLFGGGQEITPKLTPLIDLSDYPMPNFSDVTIDYLEEMKTNLKKYNRNLTPSNIDYWVSENIDYIYDIDAHGIDDYWKPFRKIIESKIDDCEGQSYAFLVLCKIYLNLEGELWCLQKPNSNDKHMIAVVDYKGKSYKFNMLIEYYNPDNSMNIVYKYSYEESVKISKYIHDRINYILY